MMGLLKVMSTALPSSCGNSWTTPGLDHSMKSTWSPKVRKKIPASVHHYHCILFQSDYNFLVWLILSCRDYFTVANAVSRAASAADSPWSAVWWQHQHTDQGLLEWKPWPPTTIWVNMEKTEGNQSRQVRLWIKKVRLWIKNMLTHPANTFPVLQSCKHIG